MGKFYVENKQFAYRVATTVSFIASPLFVAIPTFLVIALYTASDPLQGLLWWGITVLGISLAPLLFIARGVRAGRYSDRHLSLREQRLIPLLFCIGCVVMVLLVLLSLRASHLLMATLTTVIVALCVATGITVRGKWKISFHLVGIAGAVMALVIIVGSLCLLLSPLVVLTAWARWRVQAHTMLQACAGAVLAVVITVVVFWLFGIGF
jgi:hypothetical protein